VGQELLTTLPAATLGFTFHAGQAVVDDALLAAFCFREAARFPGAPDHAAELSVATARRELWSAALPTLPPARAVEAIPLPAHGFVPPPRLAKFLAAFTPTPAGKLDPSFDVVISLATETAGGARALVRHAQNTFFWANVKDGIIGSVEGITGRAALAALLEYGFTLEETQRARLRAVASGNEALAVVFERGFGEGRARRLIDVRAPEHTVVFCEVEARDPRFRGAVVAFLVDGTERVLGWREIGGVDGYEMLLGLEAVAPTLPGPSGERPEADARAELNVHLTNIARAVEPVLRALAAPATQAEQIAAIRPRPGDAEKAFIPEVAARLGLLVQGYWDQDPPRIRVAPNQVHLAIAVAPAGLLEGSPELRAAFPRGWGELASSLLPHRTWVAWSYRAAHETRGRDLDGLVWIDDHWAWFPNLVRLLAPEH